MQILRRRNGRGRGAISIFSATTSTRCIVGAKYASLAAMQHICRAKVHRTKIESNRIAVTMDKLDMNESLITIALNMQHRFGVSP